MNMNFTDLLDMVPRAGELAIDWDKIAQSGFSPYFSKMMETAQNPVWHGEGDVWAHTKMVCESLIGLEAWRALERRKQRELFIAALLHDIGKTVTTRLENGLPVSPNHTAAGDRMARTILWKGLGMCGTYDLQQFRETVCSLIRYHSAPFHFYQDKTPEYTAIKIAAKGGLVTDFTNELLSVLAEADIKGRISGDTDERLENVYFFRAVSEEAQCFAGPKQFPSSFSRYAYLSGRDIYPGQELYNDAWGTVIMLSGLPGTGKDTYIRKVYPDLPMVSLDALRKETRVPPQGPQDKVIAAAREQAKVYLRKKRPFVWNATNITPMIRERLIHLFTQYKAMVKIVYLEAPWDETLRRNRNRKEEVPMYAIDKMLDKLVPPDLAEAHEVEWALA